LVSLPDPLPFDVDVSVFDPASEPLEPLESPEDPDDSPAVLFFPDPLPFAAARESVL
jgi:hypothetical protein